MNQYPMSTSWGYFLAIIIPYNLFIKVRSKFLSRFPGQFIERRFTKLELLSLPWIRHRRLISSVSHPSINSVSYPDDNLVHGLYVIENIDCDKI